MNRLQHTIDTVLQKSLKNTATKFNGQDEFNMYVRLRTIFGIIWFGLQAKNAPHWPKVRSCFICFQNVRETFRDGIEAANRKIIFQ
jgi:hypothetical protein